MQIKNNHRKYLQKSWIIGLIKLVLLIACLYFIYEKLNNQPVTFRDLVLPESFAFTTILVSSLMILNWYLEALRWKWSVEQFEEISMRESWYAVLTGLGLNWIFPFTSGDLIARISRQKDKFQTTSAAFLNRGIMLVLTLFLGLGAISFLAREYSFSGWFVLFILFGIPILKKIFNKSIQRFLIYFQQLTRAMFMKVVVISILRYAVFVFQFYLLLSTFLPTLEAELLIAGIGWVFLVRSTLPLIMGGIGVREASGIFFFEPYVNNIELVIAPIFLIWIINTVIPSLSGLLLMLNIKPSFTN